MAEESDDSESKTEEPTEKRLEKAKEEGQILRSQDFSVAVTLFSFAALLYLISSATIETFRRLYQYNFILDAAVTRDAGLMIDKLAGSVAIVFPLVGLTCSLAVLGVLLGSSLFGGIGFSMKAAQPKLSRLNPLSGLKRMFGGTAVFELVKNTENCADQLGNRPCAVFLCECAGHVERTASPAGVELCRFNSSDCYVADYRRTFSDRHARYVLAVFSASKEAAHEPERYEG